MLFLNVRKLKSVSFLFVFFLQENAEDIYAEAKEINEERAAAEEAVEDVETEAEETADEDAFKETAEETEEAAEETAE